MFLSGSNIDAVNAEIATCGDTAHERVSTCGPVNSRAPQPLCGCRTVTLIRRLRRHDQESEAEGSK